MKFSFASLSLHLLLVSLVVLLTCSSPLPEGFLPWSRGSKGRHLARTLSLPSPGRSPANVLELYQRPHKHEVDELSKVGDYFAWRSKIKEGKRPVEPDSTPQPAPSIGTKTKGTGHSRNSRPVSLDQPSTSQQQQQPPPPQRSLKDKVDAHHEEVIRDLLHHHDSVLNSLSKTKEAHRAAKEKLSQLESLHGKLVPGRRSSSPSSSPSPSSRRGPALESKDKGRSNDAPATGKGAAERAPVLPKYHPTVQAALKEHSAVIQDVLRGHAEVVRKLDRVRRKHAATNEQIRLHQEYMQASTAQHNKPTDRKVRFTFPSREPSFSRWVGPRA